MNQIDNFTNIEGKKLKLLIICPFFPYPLKSGGHQGFFSAIEAIKNDFDIYIYYEENKDEDKLKDMFPYATLCKYTPYKRTIIEKIVFKIKAIPDNIFKKILPKLPSYKKGVDGLSPTYYYNGLYSVEYITSLNNVISKYNIDIVQIDFPCHLALVCALPSNVKKVYVHQEIHYVRNELTIKQLHLDNSPYYKFIYNLLKHQELCLLAIYDAVITVSDIDAKKLKDNGIQQVFGSISLVKTNSRMQENINSFSNYLSFLGPEYHYPNVDGLLWFLDNCWPAITEQVPNMRLRIIGEWSGKTQELWVSKYKNIEFTGFISDLYHALEKTIMIVPLQIGSGIKMKIQEAANMKIPFVSTSIGIESLPFIDGTDCFIADNTADFAQRILELINNLNLQNEFANSAYNKINAVFSYKNLRNTRLAAYNSLYIQNKPDSTKDKITDADGLQL